MYMRKSAAAAVAIVAKYFAHRPTNRVIECTSYKVHVQAWPFYMVYFRVQVEFLYMQQKVNIFKYRLSSLNRQLKYDEP